MNTRTRYLLAGASLLAVVLLAVTLRRAPTPFSDSQFYASIARSVQLHGVGIPSGLRYSPAAVDHLPFYGPVYFTLVARSFDWFGVSLRGLRVVSLAGALLAAAAAGLLAQSISAGSRRWLWAVTLLLFTPELRAYATVGTMATLAIGFELMALAVFVAGLQAERHRPVYSVAAGLLLGAAALTTPRTYLFIAAFFTGLLLCRRARAPLVLAFAAFSGVMAVWTVSSHGSVTAWARYVGFILLHEDSDVALLPGAARQPFFSLSYALVTCIAATASLAVAALLSRRAYQAGGAERQDIASAVLLTGWLSFIAGLVTLNLTFTQTTYIAIPLFVCVLAMPYELLPISRRIVKTAAIGVLSIEASLAAVWYARIAATWDARDPDALYRFIDRYVPDRAAVVGPHAPYFIAVERSGARYRSAYPESWADWARWVPVIEPDAVERARTMPKTATQGRFLIWQAGEPLPGEFACAASSPVAVYEAPPNHLDALGWLGERAWDTGYPRSVLYRLPSGCPAGYDPTHS